jgi:calcium binding protein
MAQRPRDDEREARIRDEIIVDAYGPEEQASSWYSYLGEMLAFPFLTRCVAERAISPLQVGDEVEVLGMAPEEECRHELFVTMRWEHRRTLAIPLSQLECTHADDETRQAVEDWQYWVARGYEL